MWDRAAASAQQAGDGRKGGDLPERARPCAKRILEIGLRRRQRAAAALRLGKGRDVEYAAAFALTLSGDSDGSQRLAADLASRFPEDTPVQFEYLPILRRALRRSRVGHRWTRSSDCNGRFLTISRCREQDSLANSEASIPRMYAVGRTLQQGAARRPRRNFRKF